MRIEGNPVSHIPQSDNIFLQTGGSSTTDESTLESGESTTTIFGHIGQFFSTVWNWIKKHVLCLCFDKKADQIDALFKELKTLFDIWGKPQERQERFHALSIPAKVAIAKELDASLNYSEGLTEDGVHAKDLMISCREKTNLLPTINRLTTGQRERLEEIIAWKLTDEFDPDLENPKATANKYLDSAPVHEFIFDAVKVLVMEDIFEKNPGYLQDSLLLFPPLIVAARRNLPTKIKP